MLKLSFSQNWNRGKLNNQAFTTLRMTDRFQIGDLVAIDLKGLPMGHAKVIDKKALTLDQITPGMAYLDTGYSAEETRNIIRKMYPKTDFSQKKIYWYLLVYV